MTVEFIYASIIAGVFSIVTALLNRNPDLFSWKKGKIIQQICGDWKGKGKQRNFSSELDYEYQIEVSFFEEKNKIKGELVMTHIRKAKEYKAKISIEGILVKQRFLKCNYQSVNEKIFQFGVIIMEILPDGRTLRGGLLGYGALSEKIVTMEFLLEQKWLVN